MTYRLNALLILLVALIGGPFYWLMIANPPRDPAVAVPITMAQLRTLAESIPGPHPERVELTVVGSSQIMSNLIAAGSGMVNRTYSVIAFRLPVVGKGPILIDTGLSAHLAGAEKLDHYFPERQAGVDRDLRAASLILTTSERAEHLGGLTVAAGQADGAAILAKSQLNAQQVPEPDVDFRIPWPLGLSVKPAINGDQPVAVAPGVVAIPAPSASPGSQLIYVRLRDGREYLFAGDVAPMAVNFQELRTPSNYSSQFSRPEDRPAMMRWLVTIAALRIQAPELNIVPGHDYVWIVDRRNGNGIDH